MKVSVCSKCGEPLYSGERCKKHPEAGISQGELIVIRRKDGKIMYMLESMKTPEKAKEKQNVDSRNELI